MTSHLPPFPLRTECPPGACICARGALLADPQGDLRILRLSRADEKSLLQRLENLRDLKWMAGVSWRSLWDLTFRTNVPKAHFECRC